MVEVILLILVSFLIGVGVGWALGYTRYKRDVNDVVEKTQAILAGLTVFLRELVTVLRSWTEEVDEGNGQ